jgi:predicted GH43/DUF377 family glycosyl hydrolase
MYQIWVWVDNHYEMRYAGKSRIGATFALWVFAKHWDNLKLIKKPLN